MDEGKKFQGNQYKKIGFLKRTWRAFIRGVKLVLIWSVIIATVVLAVRHYFPKVMVKVVEREVITDTLSNKIEEIKGGIIADIKQGESLGKKDCDSLITFDPNPTNKKVEIPSLGCYQYKVSTVQYYYKKLYNQDISRREAIEIALDTDRAGKLTYDIVFKENGARNWYNTSKKYNIPARIALLNEILK